MPSSYGRPSRVAIVGASSLRGKELKLVLEERNFPSTDVVLLDTSVMAGTLTEAGGEPTFIHALEEDSFESVRFAFFAGSTADSEQNWETAQRAGATVIDMTGAVAATGKTTTWIPSLSPSIPPRPGAGPNGARDLVPYYSPPAPVIVSCTLAAALGKFLPQRLAVLLFPPVSERDQPGIEELESQTANLLSFRPIDEPVFGAQVAFNLLSAYGENAKPRLADMRSEIARDVAYYLSGRAPVPAIQLVQAPVFYGYAFAAYAEFASPEPPEQLEASFANLGVRVGKTGDSAPTNVSVAGESEIQLARIEPDPSVASGVWIWGVADNLRLATTNAVRIGEELLAQPAN
ncbi:MAG TPA: Asd/ArgC dimerization domain-containing protein [Candidatus Limnocylindrales bacterium]|nr:Asd/ArgC dimerization domain-containing protein [Candidatus Limnocylindrales bacterium]